MVRAFTGKKSCRILKFGLKMSGEGRKRKKEHFVFWINDTLRGI